MAGRSYVRRACRQAAQLHSKTVSLWSYTDKHRDRFTSRTYIPYDQVPANQIVCVCVCVECADCG
jgi:hypothetical protein